MDYIKVTDIKYGGHTVYLKLSAIQYLEAYPDKNMYFIQLGGHGIDVSTADGKRILSALGVSE